MTAGRFRGTPVAQGRMARPVASTRLRFPLLFFPCSQPKRGVIRQYLLGHRGKEAAPRELLGVGRITGNRGELYTTATAKGGNRAGARGRNSSRASAGRLRAGAGGAVGVADRLRTFVLRLRLDGTCVHRRGDNGQGSRCAHGHRRNSLGHGRGGALPLCLCGRTKECLRQKRTRPRLTPRGLKTQGPGERRTGRGSATNERMAGR